MQLFRPYSFKPAWVTPHQRGNGPHGFQEEVSGGCLPALFASSPSDGLAAFFDFGRMSVGSFSDGVRMVLCLFTPFLFLFRLFRSSF